MAARKKTKGKVAAHLAAKRAASGTTRGVGRPHGYRPEYCEKAVEFLSEGYCVSSLAGELKISRDTIYRWAKEFPEFSDALKTGQAASAKYWVDALKQVASTGKGNAAACIFALKNRCSIDWREKVEHTLPVGADGRSAIASLTVKFV